MTAPIKNQCLLFLILETDQQKKNSKSSSKKSRCKGFALLPSDFKTQSPKVNELFLQNKLQVIDRDQNFECLKNVKFEIFEVLVIAKEPNLLTVFAEECDRDFVNLLFSQNVSVKLVCKFGSLKIRSAIDEEGLKAVKQILAFGPDMLWRHGGGGTFLHIAVKRGREALVKLLLENGANVDAECSDNVSCLQLAVDNGYSKIAEILLEYHPDVNNESNQKGFRNAVCWTAIHNVGINVNRFKRTVERMAQLGFTVNPEDADDFDVLYGAVRLGNTETVRKLLEYGADLDETCNTSPNMTPLHAAAMLTDGEEMMKLLLDFGADINAETEYGSTPFDCAVTNKKSKNVKFLLENGFNVLACDPGLAFAVTVTGTPEILEIILQKGGDANFETNPDFQEKRTPLIAAVSNGSLEMVEVLLKYGARIDFCDKRADDKTPLLEAIEERQLQVFQTLLDYGFSDTGLVTLTETSELFRFLESSGFDRDRDQEFKESGRKALACHLLKLEAENLCPLDVNLLVTRWGFEDLWLNEFLSKCKAEIASLKTEKVGNTHVTFHDILTQNVNRIACFARNESVLGMVTLDGFKERFPVYASVINWQFRKGQHRKNLLQRGVEICRLPSNKLSALPLVIQEKILDLISDRGIIIFNNTF